MKGFDFSQFISTIVSEDCIQEANPGIKMWFSFTLARLLKKRSSDYLY